MGAQAGTCHLLDLDDACLVNIFGRLDPLPHLFSVALVCKRFNRVAVGGRLWLRVLGRQGKAYEIVGHRKLSFDTIQEAVTDSRPGDTIIIEPRHFAHSAPDIMVDWPLRLLGGGKSAEETALYCQLGASSSVTFRNGHKRTMSCCRASGIICNLCLWSDQCPCVVHQEGNVKIDNCILFSRPAPGLEHLYTPLITTATSFSVSHSVPLKLKGRLPKREAGVEGGSPGVLSVCETKLRGKEGMRAVQTGGSGSLSGVRVISLSKDRLYWFTVDSEQIGHKGSHFWGNTASSTPELPTWAKSQTQLFPEDQIVAPKQQVDRNLENISRAEEANNNELVIRSKRWRQDVYK